MKKYTRRLSANERLWLTYNFISPPFVNQMIMEGTGELDTDKFKDAVARASEANPGSRVVLKGFLGGTRWVDSGIPPLVREVDGGNWCLEDVGNAPFLKESISPYERTCEILILRGKHNMLAFRTIHAAMDMRGTFGWMYDIFQALENRPMQGSDSTLTDFQLARRIKKPDTRKSPLGGCLAPTGPAIGTEMGFDWINVPLKGKYSSLMAQIALLLAREAWEHADGKVMFGIPVDMRTRDPQIRSTGNLSLPIYVEIKKESTLEDVASDISIKLKTMQECNVLWSTSLIKYIPLKLLQNHQEKIIQKEYRNGHYLCSGLLSNVNRIPLEIFSGGGFTAINGTAVPPGMGNMPLFMGAGTFGAFGAMVFTMPRVLANKGRLDKIVKILQSGLVPK